MWKYKIIILILMFVGYLPLAMAQFGGNNPPPPSPPPPPGLPINEGIIVFFVLAILIGFFISFNFSRKYEV